MTIRSKLSGHANSLNFIRLVLALTVLFSHVAGMAASRGYPGFKSWAGIANGTSAATIALYLFFAISGYLVAQSMVRSTVRRYFLRRVMRIFPGLLACLVIIAFGFGLVGWWTAGNHTSGLHGYFFARDNPFTYVIKNSLLANPFWEQKTIAGLPTGYLAAWDSSIWSLFYEFICYLLLIGLSVLGILKRRWILATMVGAVWIFVLYEVLLGSPDFNLFHNVWIECLLRLGLVFFTGSLIFLFGDRIPDSGYIALASAIVFMIGLMIPNSKVEGFEFIPIDVFLPALVYPILWLGIHLPFQRIAAKNDYSYGIYIYHWPIMELGLMWNLERFGIIGFEAYCIGASLPFAFASWWLIEKRALKFSPFRERASRPRKPLHAKTPSESAS